MPLRESEVSLATARPTPRLRRIGRSVAGWLSARCGLRALAPGLVLAAGLVLAPSLALACAFHGYAPPRTIVDWLLESERAVLARASPEQPARLTEIEWLRGASEDPVLPELADLPLRRRLDADPARAVLYVDDPDTGEWRSLGVVGGTLRAIAAEVLANRMAWSGAYHPARFALAAKHHDHPEPAIRALALAELDRAPYAMLRRLDLRLPAADLLTGLWTPDAADSRPIRVLLLGLSPAPRAHAEIAGRVETWASETPGLLLGAYATAFIERTGAPAVRRLAELYFGEHPHTAETREAVIEAFAIHSQVGPAALQAAITAELGAILQREPNAAAMVARQFGARNDWRHAAELDRLLRARRITSAVSMITVSRYVALASQLARGGE